MMDRAILDPSLLETQLCTGTITLTLNPQNEICVLTKDGGEAVSVANIMRIIGIAKLRVAEIEEIVKKALEKEKVKLESQTGY
jgi:exosome complex component RRP45